MGLFSKKNDKQSNIPKLPELPSLPSLPNLPGNFPSIDEDENDVHELPSFPTSTMGDKFSRDSIKSAVSGDDEEENEPKITRQELIPNAPKSAFTPQKPMSTEKMPKMATMKKMVSKEPVHETGPVFIRIDRFEEALHVFKDTREKINEIEKILEETKTLKAKEEEELSNWESEIQTMKQKIEKVDNDIFSKV